MRVLVGCEFSGTVRDAFAARGHDAWSCDLLPADGKHIHGDVFEALQQGWDLAIVHPPCTYLCLSGIHWNTRRPERKQLTEDALQFVRSLIDALHTHTHTALGVGKSEVHHHDENPEIHAGNSTVQLWP